MEILKFLRRMDNMPILVLSATPTSAHKAEMIKAGAYTYLPKPLDIEDCLLEVYALLRRYTELNANEKRCYALVSCGEIVLDRNMRTAFCHNDIDPNKAQKAVKYFIQAAEKHLVQEEKTNIDISKGFNSNLER